MGVEVWIEKSPSHTLLAGQLAQAFPDARFVGIVRRPQAVIASQLRVAGEPPPAYPARLTTLLRLSRDCSLHERWLKVFCRDRAACFLTTYEALAADPASETERICTVIGIEFVPTMLDLPWRKNTSFDSQRRPRGSLNGVRSTLRRNGHRCLRLIPLSVLRSLAARRQARGGIEWPTWCWRRRDAGVAA